MARSVLSSPAAKQRQTLPYRLQAVRLSLASRALAAEIGRGTSPESRPVERRQKLDRDPGLQLHRRHECRRQAETASSRWTTRSRSRSTRAATWLPAETRPPSTALTTRNSRVETSGNIPRVSCIRFPQRRARKPPI